jgi:ATP-binding cassette subfamily F protein 3
MDIESIQWLEDFLINSAKAVVVILTIGHLLIILQIVPLKLLWGVSMIIKPNILYLELRKDRRVHQQKHMMNNNA